jgi:hypothetical protein
MTNPAEKTELADDLCWGVKEIASVIRRTPRQTHWLLSTGKIPGRKIGDSWTSTRTELYQALTAPPESPSQAQRSEVA